MGCAALHPSYALRPVCFRRRRFVEKMGFTAEGAENAEGFWGKDAMEGRAAGVIALSLFVYSAYFVVENAFSICPPLRSPRPPR
jgi:hypothetical protein